MSASFFGATSARNTAVRSATGTPNRIAANVPIIEVRITYKIPKCGSAAAGAHFVLNKEISPYKLKGALNSYLPDDIYINDVKCVNENFHARYMVKEKTYQYKINTGNYNPLLRTHVYQYCRTLNIKKMKEALSNFKGTHDFTTFTSSEDKREDKVRTIKNVSLSFSKDIITITFKAKGFLKYQVRNMVGTLIKVGEEKVDPSIIPVLLEKKDRKSAYMCAPAEGLTLINIKY